MATIKPSILSTPYINKTVIYKWTNVNAGDTCLPAQTGNYIEFTAQVHGGTAGSTEVTWEGTLDPDDTGYAQLTDALSGSALTQSGTAAIDEVLQNCYLVKPVIGAAGGASGRTLLLMGRQR